MTLSEIARLIDGTIIGDGNVQISGIAKIEDAKKGDITFQANPKYSKYLKTTQASAVIVPMEIQESFDVSLIKAKNPYFAFLQVVNIFFPSVPLVEKGIHDTVMIGEETELEEDLSIGPNVIIGKKCRIGKGTIIMPGVVVGDEVVIGEDCTIHANVCLRERVVLGNRIIIHNGVIVGSDGFGFALEGGIYYKIPQIGIVVIEDDVEIGANTTIDRASIGETRIKKGAKLDNLIQIAHNCTVGANTVIAAQTGLSGSTHLGSNVRVGGQVGFAGHMQIGDEVSIGAQAGVSKSIPSGIMVSGYPAKPHIEELRIEASLKRLPQLIKEVKEMKEKISKLEQEKGKRC
jgi:UDP-3-O-[3-hydroxymyristoyl] glucosamine N-acyltransferase